ncbi:MAG: HEPN domain-containing protein [Rhodomicrobium sp.]
MSDVERIHGELISLRQIISTSESASDQSAFETMAAKTLLLASASYFERRICDAILEAAKNAGMSEIFVSFLDRQALERNYHSMFDWKAKNINKFLGLFGDKHKKHMEDEIKETEDLAQAVNAFIFINSQRNLLVHNNFASFSLPVVMDEIWTKFQSAKCLLDWFSQKLAMLATQILEDEEGEPNQS